MNFFIRISLAACMALAMQVRAQDTPRSIELKVDGLVCAFCAQGISKKLGRIDATAEVLVNLEKGLVAVALKPGQDIADEVLRSALTDAGYSVRSIERHSETLDRIRARLKPAS